MAVYPNDAVGSFTTASFSSMIDRKPDNEFGITYTPTTIMWKSEAGYEKRQARHRKVFRTFDLSYNKVSGLVREAIINFYLARLGDVESFNFDLTHINLTGTVRVRFSKEIKVVQVLSGSDNDITQNFYNISFALEETNT